MEPHLIEKNVAQIEMEAALRRFCIRQVDFNRDMKDGLYFFNMKKELELFKKGLGIE